MRILVTGFEPFGGDSLNASGVVVESLARTWTHPDVVLATAVLPVEFTRAPEALASAIREFDPDVVIALGEAGGRNAITPERWAGPTAHGRIADNAGFAPVEQLLDGVSGNLASRMDVDAMVAAIRAVGVPAEASSDAGRYVCNAAYRALLREHTMPATFMHLPAVRRTGTASVGAETDVPGGGQGRPLVGFDDLVGAVVAVIELVAAGRGDLR